MGLERRALLLSGPQHFDEKRPLAANIRKYYEYLDPLGIAIVSSFLKRSGFETMYAPMLPGHPSSIEGFLDNVGYVFVSSRYIDSSLAKKVIQLAKPLGKKVITGGYGPTFCPEAFQDADVVVRGEFEPVAEVVMDDLLSDRLQPEYDTTQLEPYDMSDYTYPDRTIFPKLPGVLERLRRHPQEWQRGCTNYCSFCSPVRMQHGGKEVRYRKPENIIKEIEAMGLRRGEHLFSTDLNTSSIPEDNLYVLFSYLKGKGISWYTEGTVASLLDNLGRKGYEDSLLKLMSAKDGKGGCYSFLYGADDLSRERVKGAKDKELKLLHDATNVFREIGIPLNLSLVVGLDNHRFPDTFFEYAQMISELKNPFAFVHLATPYHGTAWGWQVENEGRLSDREPGHYDHRTAVFEPKKMTSEELQQGYYWLLRVCNTPAAIAQTAKANLKPELTALNPTLGILQSGLPWSVETYLSVLELTARGHIDAKVQKELDYGYKDWLSRPT